MDHEDWKSSFERFNQPNNFPFEAKTLFTWKDPTCSPSPPAPLALPLPRPPKQQTAKTSGFITYSRPMMSKLNAFCTISSKPSISVAKDWCAKKCMCSENPYAKTQKAQYMCVCIYIYTSVGLSLYSDRVSWSSRLVFRSKVDGQHVLSECVFFYVFDVWSMVKLTGSICFLFELSSTFSLDGRSWSWRACVGGLKSLLGPLCAVLGRSWSLCWHSGGGFGTYFGCLGPFLGPYGQSWAALGACLGGLGCTWAALGTFVGDLGPLLGFSWRSWAAIGAAVCDPGPLLESILAVLGSSWGLSLRSAAALGAYAGGLGLENRRT